MDRLHPCMFISFCVSVLFLKGFCHEMNIFRRLLIIKRYFCTCADSFHNFCFLVDEKFCQHFQRTKEKI
jgi:hypothetical protein